MGEEETRDFRCNYCGSLTYEDTVKTFLWFNEKPVLIEDIPARVCKKCMEQFYDEKTSYMIDRLRQTKFPRERARRVIEVEVFSLEDVDGEKSSEQAEEAESGEETEVSENQEVKVDYTDLYYAGGDKI
ncbi:MAG: hypothetical protein DRP87_01615 [Spirochaetes bacterium]|nr:MAG: hypothetical protein DRP87_01615 [Spirochaetota bacterium]